MAIAVSYSLSALQVKGTPVSPFLGAVVPGSSACVGFPLVTGAQDHLAHNRAIIDQIFVGVRRFIPRIYQAATKVQRLIPTIWKMDARDDNRKTVHSWIPSPSDIEGMFPAPEGPEDSHEGNDVRSESAWKPVCIEVVHGGRALHPNFIYDRELEKWTLGIFQDQNEIVIGRMPDEGETRIAIQLNGANIDDKSRSISRKHIRIRRDASGMFTLENLSDYGPVNVQHGFTNSVRGKLITAEQGREMVILEGDLVLLPAGVNFLFSGLTERRMLTIQGDEIPKSDSTFIRSIHAKRINFLRFLLRSQREASSHTLETRSTKLLINAMECCNSGDYNRAIAVSKEALAQLEWEKKSPIRYLVNSIAGLVAIGESQYRLGQFDEAIETLTELHERIRSRPKNIDHEDAERAMYFYGMDGLRMLGEVYMQRGESSEKNGDELLARYDYSMAEHAFGIAVAVLENRFDLPLRIFSRRLRFLQTTAWCAYEDLSPERNWRVIRKPSGVLDRVFLGVESKINNKDFDNARYELAYADHWLEEMAGDPLRHVFRARYHHLASLIEYGTAELRAIYGRQDWEHWIGLAKREALEAVRQNRFALSISGVDMGSTVNSSPCLLPLSKSLYQLGLCLFALHELDGAREALKQAVSIYPQNAPAAAQLKDLEKQLRVEQISDKFESSSASCEVKIGDATYFVFDDENKHSNINGGNAIVARVIVVREKGAMIKIKKGSSAEIAEGERYACRFCGGEWKSSIGDTIYLVKKG